MSDFYSWRYGIGESIQTADSALYHIGEYAKVKDNLRCEHTGKVGKIVELSDEGGREKFVMEMKDGTRWGGFIDAYLEGPYRADNPTFDEKRKVYRLHPDGTPCYAKNEEDCPLVQHHKKAEEADDLGSPSSNGGETTPSALGATAVPTQEELYDIYEQEGVSDRLLTGIKGFHEAVAAGKVKPMRMPASALKDADIPMWMMGAYYVAANYPDDTTAERVLTDFAKKAGVYLGDTLEYCTKKYGDSIASGMESTIFDAGDNVAKASNFDQGDGTLEVMQRIERLILGNKFFPDTRNEVLGLGRDPTDRLSFVVEQPFVRFNDSEPISEKEVEDWTNSLGFYLRDKFLRNYTTKGGDLALLDMHNENVVRTNDGKIVCVDPCIIPNTYELGMHGFYDPDDPPEEFE